MAAQKKFEEEGGNEEGEDKPKLDSLTKQKWLKPVEIMNGGFLLRRMQYTIKKLVYAYNYVEKMSHGHRRYQTRLEMLKEGPGFGN